MTGMEIYKYIRTNHGARNIVEALTEHGTLELINNMRIDCKETERLVKCVDSCDSCCNHTSSCWAKFVGLDIDSDELLDNVDLFLNKAEELFGEKIVDLVTGCVCPSMIVPGAEDYIEELAEAGELDCSECWKAALDRFVVNKEAE